MTPRCSGSSRPSCVIISSVRPSLKYSCPASPVKFSKGKTANMTRPGTRLRCVARVQREYATKPAATATTTNPTTNLYENDLWAAGEASAATAPLISTDSLTPDCGAAGATTVGRGNVRTIAGGWTSVTGATKR